MSVVQVVESENGNIILTDGKLVECKGAGRGGWVSSLLDFF